MTIRDHKTSKKVGPKVLPLNTPLRAILKLRVGAMFDGTVNRIELWQPPDGR